MDTGLARDPLLQFGDGYVGMLGDQLDDKPVHLRIDSPLRAGPVTPPLHLPALPTLTENLLHIPKAYAEQPRQRAEASLASSMSLEYLSPQIIVVGSRHPVVVARVSPSLHYTIMAIALEQKHSWCHVPEILSVGFFRGKKPAGGVLRITVTVLLLQAAPKHLLADAEGLKSARGYLYRSVFLTTGSIHNLFGCVAKPEFR